MVLDTSAIAAILLDEMDAPMLESLIGADPVRLMSAATYVECSLVVLRRLGEPGVREFDLLLHKAAITIVAVTAEQAEIARSAFLRFGKGRHVAGLNFGDCFSYALSRTSGEPLLYKGGDFAKTDVAGAQ